MVIKNKWVGGSGRPSKSLITGQYSTSDIWGPWSPAITSALITNQQQQGRDARAAAAGLGYGFGDAAFTQGVNQNERQAWQQGFMDNVGQWEAGRAPWQQQVGQSYMDAATPALDIARDDAYRNNAINMAQRGMRHSTEDYAGQADVQLGHALSMAQAADQAYSMQRQQAGQDFDLAQQLRAMGYGVLPGEMEQYGILSDYLRARQGMIGEMGGIENQRNAMDRAYQNAMSSAYGTAITGAAGAARAAGPQLYNAMFYGGTTGDT